MQTLRHLLLLRHAKSSWDDPALADEDRPLSPRGKRAAAAMGRFIEAEALAPDLVLCSPARRAVETWALVAAELAIAPECRTVAALYDFGDGTTLLDTIRQHGHAARRLMIVGHNPAMENLAHALTGSGDEGLRRALETKFPTAAVAVLSFTLKDWKDLAAGSGELTHFIRPRDLPGS